MGVRPNMKCAGTNGVMGGRLGGFGIVLAGGMAIHETGDRGPVQEEWAAVELALQANEIGVLDDAGPGRRGGTALGMVWRRLKWVGADIQQVMPDGG
ncbi:hypothetical protein [Salmonella enterica]|uniref:hypothetical protein n=1 Tax=Salmonella enterica TaxID=28901 RepID=UPI00398C33CD